MQEICDNGLDDDNDGLFDGFDPDCQCDIESEFRDLIPNSDFGQLNGCCTIIDEGEIGCIDSWRKISGYFMSITYYDKRCNEVHFNVNTNNTELGEDPLLAITTFAQRTQEAPHMTIQLTSPLAANKTASISLNMAYFSWYPDSLLDTHLITFYGIHDAAQISNITDDIAFCNSNISYELLGIPDQNALTINTMQEVTIPFTPTRDIEAIVIGQNCNFNRTENHEGATNFIRSLDIITALHSNFSHSEIVCDQPISIVAEVDTFDSYQWYVDSLPVQGANDYLFDFGPIPDQDVLVHLEVSGRGICTMLGPINSEWEYPTDQVIDTVWICDGTSYDHNSIMIDEEGTYRDTLSNEYGCDSITELTLMIYPLQSEIVMNEDIICTNETYLYQGYIYDSAGVYDVMLSDRWGCDSTVMLLLTDQSALIGDTSYVTLSEGESIPFGDSVYSLPGLYSYINEADQKCGIIEYLQLEVIKENDLKDAIYIPNIFSPNGDQMNDELIISYDPEIVSHIDEIKIYNRWGNVLISGMNELKWNGKFSDGSIHSSVYICLVKATLLTGREVEIVGAVQVVQ